jgi:putative intracellular protease/amidase
MHRLGFPRPNRIRSRALAALVLLAVLLTLGAAGAAPADQASPPPHREYVCPMSEHPQVFDHPGKCPICGMQLVRKTQRVKVAIMVFDNVQIIDFTAPYEVFGEAGFDIFTVGPTTQPITTVNGMRVTPAYGFADAPPADVVVLPGGGVDVDDARIVDWVKRRAAASGIVLSVCNGAFWLAKAGLLDGLTATTTSGRIAQLQAEYPKVRVVRDQRWVDNGRIVTAAGLSSGLEGALHVVERLQGHGKARTVALHAEYDWRPQSHWTRASLADRFAGHLDLGDDLSYEEVSAYGDLDHWRIEGVVTTGVAPATVLERIGDQIEARWHWTSAGPARSTGGVISHGWTFKDERGRPWTGTLRLASRQEAGELEAVFDWSRNGAPPPS